MRWSRHRKVSRFHMASQGGKPISRTEYEIIIPMVPCLNPLWITLRFTSTWQHITCMNYIYIYICMQYKYNYIPYMSPNSHQLSPLERLHHAPNSVTCMVSILIFLESTRKWPSMQKHVWGYVFSSGPRHEPATGLSASWDFAIGSTSRTGLDRRGVIKMDDGRYDEVDTGPDR